MSVDMFLEIKGVDGQTQDKGHKGKKLIDIQGWSFGCSNSGNLHTGTGGSGKVSYTDIQINKPMCSASSKLLQHCNTGKVLDSAVIRVRKAIGEKPVEYFTLNMNSVIVKSLGYGASGGADGVSESLTLHFKNYELDFVPVDLDKGTAGSKQQTTWDIATNSAK